MKYSYATVSLYDLTPEQAVEELRRAGYQGVEWRVGDAPHAMRSSASRFLTGNLCTLEPGMRDSGRISRLCADAGLAVVGLGPYLEVADLDGLEQMVAMALELGAPQVRIQAPRADTAGFDYPGLVRSTKAFLAAGERLGRAAGVRIVLETHQNTIAPSASLAAQLVSSFDPAAIGVIYDFGNLVWEGYEQHRMALEILGPYLHHVHLKNASASRDTDGGWRYAWSALDDGLVDVPAALRALTEAGYDGWISIEDLSTVRSPSETLRHNARVLAALPEAAWTGSGNPSAQGDTR
ncbi:sugar phosphate isomerase/epimerase [Streptomyces sp. NPDC097610]|uniref:sugar phosphate isomerase/epimerase family protein n=1 Tax=Streptomyces sp. NPDC097610 TaxID=3157227 RepID=UPI00332E0358